MKHKNLAKNLLATTALALTVVSAPASLVRAEGAQETYTVEKNDNLSRIAQKIYGNDKLWKIIYEANSGTIKSDYIIYPNQVLIVPAVTDNSAPTVTTPTTETAATAPAAPEAPATTPAPETTPPTATPPTTQTAVPAPATDQEFVLDYSQLASWIDGGFVGTSTTGEAVIMATNADDTYGIIIFADDSDRTAASFVGPITYTDEYMTITDEANGLALTFAVSEVGDGVLALDMGSNGVATVAAQVRETVLDFIRLAIEGYTHVA